MFDVSLLWHQARHWPTSVPGPWVPFLFPEAVQPESPLMSFPLDELGKHPYVPRMMLDPGHVDRFVVRVQIFPSMLSVFPMHGETVPLATYR